MPLPIFAAAISAIGPMLAQKGLDLLSGVFKGTIDKGTEQIGELIKANTGIEITDVADDKLTDEQWAALKEFEHLHQEELLAYLQGMEVARMDRHTVEPADRADARSLQKNALQSGDKLASQFIYWYAILVTLLTFTFIFIAVFKYPADNPGAGRVIDTVLGFLLGVSLSAIIQFFFGSSQGSSNKQKHIERLTEKVGLMEQERTRRTGGQS